jgi:4-hydroxythreonine-4-phosphate dehydrogenase
VQTPTFAITVGDPGGIGPEVAVKALADQQVQSAARFRVFGPIAALDRAAHAAGVAHTWRAGDAELVDAGTGRAFPAKPTAAGGELSFRLVEDAIAAAKLPLGDARRVDGVVTGPISKAAWAMAGHREFPGHTELFAARFGVERYGMMFFTPRLRVILATAHVPLMRVGPLLTPERVERAIGLGDEACRRAGVERPRVAVCGLNPHAGEEGLLGTEDDAAIKPAIDSARRRGIDAHGPFPGDTVFIAAAAGRWDLVVAMYHDQGLIPVKLLDRDRAVNVTVGLPIVRTSPDHGTAFDIAGQNRADPGSMKAAILLAARLARPGCSPCGAPA